jgi:hypothetical protein
MDPADGPSLSSEVMRAIASQTAHAGT